jgi:hypothetical protein
MIRLQMGKIPWMRAEDYARYGDGLSKAGYRA